MIPVLLLGVLQAPDRAALVAGVDGLVASGALPGAMVAAKGAFVVMRAGDVPLFVATHVGRGRALAGGHEVFFDVNNVRNPGNARFFANAVAWLGGRPASKLQVGALGMSAVNGTIAVRRDELRAGLAGLDVLMMNQGALDGDLGLQDAVVAWTKAGHGLLVLGPAWGWQQLNPSKNLVANHGGNRMLLPFGIGFSTGIADGKPSAANDDPLLATDSALSALRKGGLSPAEVARATGTVERALELMPAVGGEIRSLAAAEGGVDGPTSKRPITRTMPFSRLWARLQAREIEEGNAASLGKFASTDDFPGIVPKEAARSPKKIVTVDKNFPGWANTGLYAAPGEFVTITTFDTDLKDGLGVRIGAQTDELWGLDSWARFPKVSYRWPLAKKETRVMSPFGGTIYIDVPRGAHNGSAVYILNAVPAPRYIPQQVTNEDWAKMLATPGAPWVELEGTKVVLSLPRWAVADLKDPVSLMKYWDKMMELCFAFYAAPPRATRERYAVDRQISAGYMHSGYPIMTFEDVAKTFADLSKLRAKGSTWGFYHEMGHNFQEGDWTFSGTGEVTNNLFSLYASEKLNGVTPNRYEEAHPAMSKGAQSTRLKTYLAKGARFEDWENDPFLALTMYVQIREAFGWEPFTRVFGEYRRENVHPQGETAKRDEWMVRMACATGHNLGPFFVAWGVPTSETARRSIADLPAWMPAYWPNP